MLEYCFNACAPSNISKIINLKYSKRGGDCPPQFKMWGGHVPPVNTGRNASASYQQNNDVKYNTLKRHFVPNF